MIIGDIETTEKVEYEDLLKNYYEKMEIIEEQDKEIERLNNIINETKKILLLNFDTTTTIFNALNKLSEVDE